MNVKQKKEKFFMRNFILIGVLVMLFVSSGVVFAKDKTPTTTKCDMKFNLKGWSVYTKLLKAAAGLPAITARKPM